MTLEVLLSSTLQTLRPAPKQRCYRALLQDEGLSVAVRFQELRIANQKAKQMISQETPLGLFSDTQGEESGK